MAQVVRGLKGLAKLLLSLLGLALFAYATLPAWLPLGLQAWVNARQGGTLLLDPEYPAAHSWSTRIDWRYPGGTRLRGRLQVSYDWHSLSQGRLKDIVLTEAEMRLGTLPSLPALSRWQPKRLEALWLKLGAPPFDSMNLHRVRIFDATAKPLPVAQPAAAAGKPVAPVQWMLPLLAEMDLHWRSLPDPRLDISLCADCQSQDPKKIFVLSGRWRGQDGEITWQAPGASMRLLRTEQRQKARLTAQLSAQSPLASGLIRSAQLDLNLQQLGPLTDWMSLLRQLRVQGQLNADLQWLGQKLKLMAQLAPTANQAWGIQGSLRGQGEGFELPQADLDLGIRFQGLLPELKLTLSGQALRWQGHLWQLTGQQFRFEVPWQIWPKRGDWYALLSGRFKGQLAGWQFLPFDLRGGVSVRNARQLRLELGLGMKPAEFGQLYVRHDWSSSEGLLDIQMNWPDLSQQLLPAPSQLLANWPASLSLTQGGLNVQSQWRWSNQYSSAPQLNVQASHLQGSWQSIPFELNRLGYQYNPSLPIPSRSLWQLQQGKFGRALVLDPVDGQLYWPWWQDRAALYPLQLQAGLLGGQLIAQNTGVKGDGHRIDIQAQNLQLAPLLALADQPDLQGEGWLSGSAHLQWNDQGWSLPRGKLVGTDGRLLWSGQRSQWLTRGRQYLNLLTDFRYRQLQAQWERGSEPLLVALELEGQNPGYYRGQNLSLNLGIGVPLRNLLLQAR